MTLELNFDKREMISFLSNLGYTIETISTWNADFDDRFSNKEVAYIDVDIAYKTKPIEDTNLSLLGCYRLSSKYGLEKQFTREIKYKLLNN